MSVTFPHVCAEPGAIPEARVSLTESVEILLITAAMCLVSVLLVERSRHSGTGGENFLERFPLLEVGVVVLSNFPT